MLLETKTAIVYGGGGSIGSAVARAFAREGAAVFLAGRTLAALAPVAEEITASGGVATAAQVDALSRQAVEEHAAAVLEQAGGIDITFNATSNGDVQGSELIDLPFEDFARPVTRAMTTQFLTATAVARHMIKRGSGVILAMGGGREAVPTLGGSSVAWATMAALCRQLACELGPHGVRVAWLLSPGSPEAIPETDDTTDPLSTGYGSGRTRDDILAEMTAGTMLRRLPSLDDVANAAVLVASDRARAMTSTEINVTCGSATD